MDMIVCKVIQKTGALKLFKLKITLQGICVENNHSYYPDFFKKYIFLIISLDQFSEVVDVLSTNSFTRATEQANDTIGRRQDHFVLGIEKVEQVSDSWHETQDAVSPHNVAISALQQSKMVQPCSLNYKPLPAMQATQTVNCN